MSDLRDPPRWLESDALAPDVRHALADYGSAAPSSERRARMLSNLEQQLGTQASLPNGAGLTATAKLKLLLGGVFFASSVALVALFWRVDEPHAASLPLPLPLPPPAVDWLPSSAPAPRFELRAAEPLPQPADEAFPRAVHPEKQRALPSAQLTPPPLTPPTNTAPEPWPAESAPAPRATTPAGTSPAPASADPLAELTLLAHARRSLLVHPERALELAAQHARLYPRGTFEEEREVLAIESLLKLSRSDEARRRARAFERRFPNSSHRTHLIRLVAPE